MKITAKRIGIGLVALATSCFITLTGVRVINFGMWVSPEAVRNGDGMSMFYTRRVRFFNLWPTTLHVAVTQRSCSCTSAQVSNADIHFLGMATVDISVNAIGKGQEFAEGAVIACGRTNDSVLRKFEVSGKGFGGVAVIPDAILVRNFETLPYRTNFKVKVPHGIPLGRIQFRAMARPGEVVVTWTGERVMSVGDLDEATASLILDWRGPRVGKIPVYLFVENSPICHFNIRMLTS